MDRSASVSFVPLNIRIKIYILIWSVTIYSHQIHRFLGSDFNFSFSNKFGIIVVQLWRKVGAMKWTIKVISKLNINSISKEIYTAYNLISVFTVDKVSRAEVTRKVWNNFSIILQCVWKINVQLQFSVSKLRLPWNNFFKYVNYRISRYGYVCTTWQHWQCGDAAPAILANRKQDKTPLVVSYGNCTVTFQMPCIKRKLLLSSSSLSLLLCYKFKWLVLWVAIASIYWKL
jgi:hypothetical protein